MADDMTYCIDCRLQLTWTPRNHHRQRQGWRSAAPAHGRSTFFICPATAKHHKPDLNLPDLTDPDAVKAWLTDRNSR